MNVKRLEKLDSPGAVIFNSYVLYGINCAYQHVLPEEMADTDNPPFFVFFPQRQVVRDRSTYKPHQGKQECERRVARRKVSKIEEKNKHLGCIVASVNRQIK